VEVGQRNIAPAPQSGNSFGSTESVNLIMLVPQLVLVSTGKLLTSRMDVLCCSVRPVWPQDTQPANVHCYQAAYTNDDISNQGEVKKTGLSTICCVFVI
jgi:hypothetical protein